MRSFLLVLLSVVVSFLGSSAHGQNFETLFSENEGWNPSARLIQGSDGNFYGTTSRGGATGHGTVFKITPAGKLTTLVSFNSAKGDEPLAGVVEGSDGNFYGTTNRGGSSDQGTIFMMTPSGVLTTLYSFDRADGYGPSAGLVEGKDGDFYGTTSGGGANHGGTMFKVTRDGVLTTIASFDGPNGKYPLAELVEGSDGNFYGTTREGGAIGYGTVFKVTPAGALTTLFSFDGRGTGGAPLAELVEGSDGNFYGTTNNGGANQDGTVFRVTPAGAFTTLVSFNTTNGSSPSAGLVLGDDGNFYGTTEYGGARDLGSVFKMTPAGDLTTLVSFNPGAGERPRAGLLKGSDGNFYGTTDSGGVSVSKGTIFKITSAGDLTTLVSLGSNVGSFPSAGLIEGSDGSFYGTTFSGGASDKGTIYRITTAGTFTTLVSFNGTNGGNPLAGLVEGIDGNFYGTTQWGGAMNRGTIFRMTPAGLLTTLVSFNNTNGSNPSARLIEGSDGNFYGTTEQGGAGSIGTIFKMTPAGVLTTLASFNGYNGTHPRAGLVEGSDGNFYGTTWGGAIGYGTVFKVTPEGAITTLASFHDVDYGSWLSTELVEGNDGNFYGTTWRGGNDYSTFFRVTPTGVLTTLASFKTTYGSKSSSGLIKGRDGSFYGTILESGVEDYGSIFKVTPEGAVTILWEFDGTTAGDPRGAPVLGSDGKLYGTASQMVIWRLSLPASATLSPASAITNFGVTLTGTVHANGADTSVTFEYGRTPALGNSIAATPENASGTSATSVAASILGLAPHTTYYYRLSVLNSGGATNTAVASFTTVNSLPEAGDDSFAPVLNKHGQIALDVVGNDTDADGDVLTITALTQGSFGRVSTNGATLTYTPGPLFRGRDSFSYTLSDGLATATAQVEIMATAPFHHVLVAQGSEVPGAGVEGSGIPAGSLFKTFGVPSINAAGKLAFTASYGAPGSESELGVFGYEPQGAQSTLAALRGQTAAGTAGAHFSSFKDPLLNEAGEIAFLATLSGGDTTKRNREGIWVSSFTEVSGLGLELLARTGAQPPGVPDGALWKRFTSMAFSGNAVDPDGSSWVLAFTGFLSTGQGGVVSNNDMGLWIATRGTTALALREGQKLFIGETEKQLRSFAALKALPGALGQGSGVTNEAGIPVQAFFTDGSHAVLRVNSVGEGGNATIEALALSGDAVAGLDETAARLGLPTPSNSGEETAWVGTLSGKGNPVAILQHNQNDLEFLRVLARRGDAAAGIEGASFSAFRNVAVNDSGSALFLGKVKGRGVSGSNDEGLWWRQGRGDSPAPQLLVREGSQASEVPVGTEWSAFSSIALPEGPYGPLFTAILARGKEMMGPERITKKNDEGIWGIDSTGALRLIVREGQEVRVEGDDVSKTLKSFSVLSAVSGSPTQRRSFDSAGRITYRALFTDGSQAIVKVQLP